MIKFRGLILGIAFLLLGGLTFLLVSTLLSVQEGAKHQAHQTILAYKRNRRLIMNIQALSQQLSDELDLHAKESAMRSCASVTLLVKELSNTGLVPHKELAQLKRLGCKVVLPSRAFGHKPIGGGGGVPSPPPPPSKTPSPSPTPTRTTSSPSPTPTSSQTTTSPIVCATLPLIKTCIAAALSSEDNVDRASWDFGIGGAVFLVIVVTAWSLRRRAHVQEGS